MDKLIRDNRSVVIMPVEGLIVLESWMINVTDSWVAQWMGKDHRYGNDFASFIGERFLTDFDMRDRVKKKIEEGN